MTEKDQGQPSNPPKLELVMPSLPELYDGVFEDVYADYIDDPEAFEVKLMHNLEEENPEIIPFFSSMELYDDKISFKWPMIYYEMFARSSRRDGMPPLFITEQRAIQDTKLRILEVIQALESPRSGDEYITRRKNTSLEREIRDRENNVELEKFWNTVDADIQSRSEEGASDPELITYLINLHTLQELLQKQHDEYQLTGKYLSDSYDI